MVSTILVCRNMAGVTLMLKYGLPQGGIYMPKPLKIISPQQSRGGEHVFSPGETLSATNEGFRHSAQAKKSKVPADVRRGTTYPLDSFL